MTFVRRPRRIPRSAAAPILLAVCAALALTANATSPSAWAEPAQTNPPLARIEIDVWPEYDRPSSALVILRAEIAADVTLPVPVSMRIPAASGGPTAVATAASASSRLLTLPWERSDVQVDFMTISFEATDRFFHVEFYDPLGTDTPERTYKYLWPGDFTVAQATVQLKEPALSSAVSVTPDLGAPQQGQDGLLLRQADLGALEAGTPLTVEVGYTRTDLRTSAEILGLSTAGAPPQSSDGSDWTATRLIALAGVILGVIVAGLLVWDWRRREAAAAAVPRTRAERRRAGLTGETRAFCTKCGGPLAAGDRFCASCGHPVSSRD